jgi:hypothetical protein
MTDETAQPVMIPYATHLEVVAEHLRQTAPEAAEREALAWVMRNCVKDGAIIPSEHRDAINAALRATEKP